MKDTFGLGEDYVEERHRQQVTYDKAVAAIRQKEIKQEASGYALMASVGSYGEAAAGNGWFGKTARFAQYVCITFAMVAPLALFIRIVL